jgi:hypothetical protein
VCDVCDEQSMGVSVVAGDTDRVSSCTGIQSCVIDTQVDLFVMLALSPKNFLRAKE